MKRLFIIFAICGCVYAQQPATSRLNADASATWKRVDQAIQSENDRHQKEMERLAELRAVMLQAAGVPAEAWQYCAADANGIIVCQKPAVAAASPEKKKE